MNRGAAESRNGDRGNGRTGATATARNAAQKAVLVISGCLFTSLLCAATGQQSTPSVTAIESLIRSGKQEKALRMTRSALKETPGDFRLWTLEGIVLSMQDKKKDAQAAFEEALRMSPQYAPALKGEAQILYEQSDQHAIPLLERILKSDPGDRTAHEMLGILERKQGRCEPAVSNFAASWDVVENHIPSLEAYGYCLVQLKRSQDAVSVFQRLVALLPDRTYPRYDLAVVQVAAGQNESALKTLEPLLTPGQADPDILSLASQAAEAVKDTPKAVSLLRQAIVLSPMDPDYYVAFAALCLDHDSFQVGIDMIDAGLSRIPTAASLYLSRGLLYAKEAEYDKAEADFVRAGQLDATQSMSSYAADLAEMQKNNPREALRRVQQQLKAHPDSALLHFLLAKLLMQNTSVADSDAYQAAKSEDMRALALKPDLVSAIDLMANIELQAGHYENAIAQCRTALEYSANDETATYLLLISLRHAGRTNELQPLVQRLSELHRQSLQNEIDGKRFILVEQPPRFGSGTSSN